MRTNTVRFSRATLAVFVWLTLGAAASRADTIYTVTLDTSALGGSGLGPFAVAFVFAQGDGGATDTATLSNFSYGGGSAGGTTVFADGSPTGSLESGSIVLPVTSGFSDFAETLIPGTEFNFTVDIASTAVSIPDTFSFNMLYDVTPSNTPYGYTALQTDNPDGTNSFFSGNVTGTSATYSTGAAGPDTNSPVTISAPDVTSPVPEPAALTLLILSMSGVGVRYCWRKRRQI